jgi:hypothetical protein
MKNEVNVQKWLAVFYMIYSCINLSNDKISLGDFSVMFMLFIIINIIQTKTP